MRRHFTLLLSVLGASAVVPAATGQCEPTFIDRWMAFDPRPYTRFGDSVAMNDDHIVVSAWGGLGSFGVGEVYLYKASDRSFVRKIPKPAPDPNAWGRWGIGVELAGDLAIIAASGSPGRVAVCDAPTGELLHELVPSDQNLQGFGANFAVDDGLVAVAADQRLSDDPVFVAGVVYIFDLSTGAEIRRIDQPDMINQNGFRTVALDGNLGLFGAPNHGGNDGPGRAYLVDISNGAILQTFDSPDPRPFGRFGVSVALEGDLALIGQTNVAQGETEPGKVYAFDTHTGLLEHTLAAIDGEPGEGFGEAVTTGSGQALVWARSDYHTTLAKGSVYVFDLASGAQRAKILAQDVGVGDNDDNREFGSDFVIYDGKALIGGEGTSDYSGVGVNLGAVELHALCVDTDGDGLLDEWETLGIPYVDLAGDEQRLELPGADPMHKDLYIEIDAMTGFAMHPDAAFYLEAAFGNAPVQNPDGVEGVEIHLVRDDTHLPYQSPWTTSGCWPVAFDTYRAAYFGTAAERTDPDRATLLEAKAKAYRYGIIADRSGPTSWGGCGLVDGDEFVVYFGGAGVAGNPLNEAAVFMHEIGHNLGLHHGGGDAINGKPNYPSIMNYVQSYDYGWNHKFWQLDYSRAEAAQLPALHEGVLDETAGIGTPGGRYANYWMPFGVTAFDAQGNIVRGVRGVRLDGRPTDFGDLLGTGFQDFVFSPAVVQDLNYVANPPAGVGLPTSPSPGQLLAPHDDWGNIVLETKKSRGGAAALPPEGELTEEAIAWIRDNFADLGCPADLTGDGFVNTNDFFQFLAYYQAQDARADFTGEGDVNTNDFFAFLAAYQAGCA